MTLQRIWFVHSTVNYLLFQNGKTFNIIVIVVVVVEMFFSLQTQCSAIIFLGKDKDQMNIVIHKMTIDSNVFVP